MKLRVTLPPVTSPNSREPAEDIDAIGETDDELIVPGPQDPETRVPSVVEPSGSENAEAAVARVPAPENDEQPTPDTPAPKPDYMQLFAPDLKAELKKREISWKGKTKKAQFAALLEADDAEKAVTKQKYVQPRNWFSKHKLINHRGKEKVTQASNLGKSPTPAVSTDLVPIPDYEDMTEAQLMERVGGRKVGATDMTKEKMIAWLESGNLKKLKEKYNYERWPTRYLVKEWTARELGPLLDANDRAVMVQELRRGDSNGTEVETGAEGQQRDAEVDGHLVAWRQEWT